jgi:hypothetical protein
VLETLTQDDRKAAALVKSERNRGVGAESLDVRPPNTIFGDKPADPDGSFLILFYSGIGDGFWLCGPFSGSEEAEQWAEQTRYEYESWSLMEVSEQEA